jgi:WD40 repeat protein
VSAAGADPAPRPPQIHVWELRKGVVSMSMAGHTDTITGAGRRGSSRAALGAAGPAANGCAPGAVGPPSRPTSPLSSLLLPQPSPGMSLSPDGSFLLTNAMDNTLRAWDVRPYAPPDR